MNPRGFDRRLFLKGVGVAASISVAGCTEESDSTQPTETRTETSTPTQTQTETQTETTSRAPEEEVQDTDGAVELGHLQSITGQTYPPDIEGSHHRRFEWSAVGGEWWLELNISKKLWRYYEERYSRSPKFDMYVTDPYGDSNIQFIADEFTRIGNKQGLSKREIVNLAVAFVQQLQYTKDALRTGFDQHTYYPVEVLLERGGDCEDVSILLAAILRKMGYDCVLLGMWNTEPAHMALGVLGDSSIEGSYYEHNGDRYYYVEATNTYKIGEMPDWDGSLDAEIIEISYGPSLVYGYETSVQEESVAVDFAIANHGRGTARQTTFIAEFEDQSGQIHTQEVRSLGTLNYDEDDTGRVVLQPRDDVTLRLNAYVTIGDEIHDYSQSEWRRPS